jgi:hypothetical protein
VYFVGDKEVGAVRFVRRFSWNVKVKVSQRVQSDCDQADTGIQKSTVVGTTKSFFGGW